MHYVPDDATEQVGLFLQQGVSRGGVEQTVIVGV